MRMYFHLVLDGENRNQHQNPCFKPCSTVGDVGEGHLSNHISGTHG